MQTSLLSFTETKHKSVFLIPFPRQEKVFPPGEGNKKYNSFIGTRVSNPCPLVLSRRGNLQYIEKVFILTESFFILIRLISERLN
jgi:hypothetical protein